jgi:hypothetical protein
VSEGDPIAFPKLRSISEVGRSYGHVALDAGRPVTFDRLELNQILDLYGRGVAGGEWRDYAIDMGRDRAVFSVFRRASEVLIYRIEKNPKLARKQGAYAVITATGLILKRGPDLKRVLAVLEKGPRLVD